MPTGNIGVEGFHFKFLKNGKTQIKKYYDGVMYYVGLTMYSDVNKKSKEM